MEVELLCATADKFSLQTSCEKKREISGVLLLIKAIFPCTCSQANGKKKYFIKTSLEKNNPSSKL